MIRVVVLAGVVLLALAVARLAIGAARRQASGRPGPPPRRPGGYEWESPTAQLYRRFKGLPAVDEDRDRILRFLESRRGVEAYMEPRTVLNPLSVVLIDEHGEWARFQLQDDAFIRHLARERRIPVLDASKVGYPERMRGRRGGEDAAPGGAP